MGWRNPRIWLGFGAVAAAAAIALAGDGKERLRDALGDPDPSPEWIYDDLFEGVAVSKKTGKPMLVVFR
jgi:hypothetical protein